MVSPRTDHAGPPLSHTLQCKKTDATMYAGHTRCRTCDGIPRAELSQSASVSRRISSQRNFCTVVNRRLSSATIMYLRLLDREVVYASVISASFAPQVLEIKPDAVSVVNGRAKDQLAIAGKQSPQAKVGNLAIMSDFHDRPAFFVSLESHATRPNIRRIAGYRDSVFLFVMVGLVFV